MPTKSNNTGGRGGARPGAGRKKSAVKDKAENGNPGGRKLEVLDIPEVEGVAMPKPHDFLSAEQRDGSVLQAQEIYTETWQWLKGIGCAAKVSPQLLERYAMCSARWVQCEEMTNRMGFLSKHPTTGKPIPSPFINIGINYMNQAVRLWNEIFQIVKENCSTEYGESTPQSACSVRERGNTMFEKVNPCHPDKVADRIAGALVDLAYKKAEKPRIAVEVLIGHGVCHIIAETSITLDKADITAAVHRIAGNLAVDYVEVPQDGHLADNQADGVRCGDNGIFKGMPMTEDQKTLSEIARNIFSVYPYDGKYILDGDRLILCQSNAETQHLREIYPTAEINPLGDWIGGTDVDTGATNRKLGSDMADSVTGGGLHGKDLSKADVSVNIYAFLKAQETGKPVTLCCAIGDNAVDGRPYEEIVEIARKYISDLGGFEKFAEWGLV